MIKDNQQIFNRLHFVIDAIVIALSYLFAWYLKFKSGLLDYEMGLSMETYFMALYFIVPGYLLLYYQFDLYSSKRASGRKRELFNIIKSNTVGLVAFIVVLYVINNPDFSRQMIFIFWAVNIVAETAVRNVIRYALRFIRRRGKNLKYVLLVGYSKSAESYINRIRLNPQWGYVVRGILDDHVDRGTMYKGVKVLGKIDNLAVILPENKLDEIAITLSLAEYGRLPEIVEQCEKSGVHTKFIPDYAGVIPNKPYTEDLQGLPVINIRHVPLSNTLNAVMKRAADIVGAFLALILASPVMIIAAIAVKATSKGPVIFAQERIGMHNKPFRMYKFRTMYVQEANEERKAWTTKDDPRVTKVGKFLRRTSIDELPQLFNILIGQMSLVGPRPERPQFVEKFREEIPRYMVKHQVRPGLTGWAQVNGYRGDTSIEKRIEYDLYYIENWTFGFDFRILFLTVFKGFINENAY
ncbi:MAG: undecaprenyl-phosphate glucose phosphotransferase [Lachnospiraceae bacterium]|nr:undecaprenyl-phosphate glucose phosphotransferase [Lachnospiraceae bacterium]MCR4683881.1 undecaprenyl-phosphate glucose phosphotransferase [Lachnospiraceae bacterium]